MPKRAFYYFAVFIIILIALGARFYAAARLDVDFDEPVYLSNAIAYAKFMRTGQFNMVAWYGKTYEHPSFYKILYGAALLTQPPLDALKHTDLMMRSPINTSEARKWIIADRYVSVFFGTLAVAVLAMLNPLAGFFLGVGTLSVKYTSEVYLEALPLLASLLSALMYLRWFENIRRDALSLKHNAFWIILSAIFLGLTAASKYVYCIVGLVIVVHFVLALLQKQISQDVFIWLIGWGIFSMLIFFAFNPYLWPRPLDRLIETIQYHINFQKSKYVVLVRYPFWQPLIWLSNPARFYDLKPRSAFLLNIDIFICIFAIIGLPRLFQQKRFFFYWLLIGLSFLLVWTTKWPQYVLIIMVPFSLAAGEGVVTIWQQIIKLYKFGLNKLSYKNIQGG